MLESVHAPLEVKRGFIRSVSVVVPWTKLLSENCNLEINGLELTVALKNEREAGGRGNEEGDVTFVVVCNVIMLGLASMAGSMSAGDPMAASMKIAEDCMKEEPEEETSGQYEGVEALAKMIDSGWSDVEVFGVFGRCCAIG